MTQITSRSSSTDDSVARLSLPGRWTPIGWSAPDGLTFDDWCAIGEVLAVMTNAVHWWLGDYFCYGQHRWGEKYAQMMDESKFAYSTLARDCWVAGRIEFYTRRQELTFSHHVLVASLEPSEQNRWLKCAVGGDGSGRWSVRRLKEEIQESQKLLSDDRCRTLPEPDPPPEPPAPEPLTTPADYRAARAELDAAPKPRRKEMLEALVETWENAQEQADDTVDLATCPNCGYSWSPGDA